LKTADFVEARRRLGAKSLATTEKLTSLPEAVARVRDGDHVAIGGCMFTRTPLALLMEILRQGRTQLTLSKNLMCYEGEWFMAVDAVQNVITSWLGIGLPWGISRLLREKGESGQLHLEDWSHMGLGMRYRAGAMGLPFLPTLTMLGSDLARVTETRTMICPFTGETLNLVPALFPDVALLHVHRADRYGNCQIDGYPFMDYDVAASSAAVLVTAEEIIPEDDIRRHPDRTAIPGFMVDAVVHVPYGAFPHEMHGRYAAYFEHFDDYTNAIKVRGTRAIHDYLKRYVYGVRTHAEYLECFGPAALERQAGLARELMP
jgi:glutaconate CoA-transferase subunit A